MTRKWFVALVLVASVALISCSPSGDTKLDARLLRAGQPFSHQMQPLVESDDNVTYTANHVGGSSLPIGLTFDSATLTFSAEAPESIPEILNPAEELAEFATYGILRWTAVEGADVYQVRTYADAALGELVEVSRELSSRQHRFALLTAGRTYYVKLSFRVGGLWGEAPVVTLRTTSTVVKPRLTNEQEELDGFHTAGVLHWTTIPGAETYEAWIYRDADLTVFAENSGPVRVTQYRPRTLEAGKRYYVQLYSRVAGAFHAGGALPITVVATSDRARIVNSPEELDSFAEDGQLRWTAVTGASAYEVWIYTTPDGSVVQERSGPLTQRSYTTQTLRFWTLTYFTRVNAYVNGQWQVGPPVVRLTIARKPTVARLTNAQEDLEAFGTTGTLHWTEVPGADGYEVWIFGNAGLGVVAESGVGSDLSYTVRRLCDEATYYVQVYAHVDGAWTVGWATPLRVTEGASAADCVPPAPEVDLTASAEEVQSGDRVTLTWNAKFATNCTASDAWSGQKAIRGEESVRPIEESSRYSLVCTGPSGTSLGQVRVTVEDPGTEVAPQYRAVDLGNLGGDYDTLVHGLNNLGQAVGQSALGGGLGYHPFLWVDGVMTDLGTWGGSWGVAQAINDAGQIAGWAELPGDVSQRAFVHSAGTMRDIGTLGGTFSQAYDVNASGQVVGDSDTADGPGGSRHPFLFSGGVMTDLGTLGNRFGFARGVNEAGHVVGFVPGPYPYRNLPFLFRDGEMRSLGTLGGLDGQAYDINNVGDVVGSSSVLNLDGHAFLYTDGVMVDLGTLGGETSRAYAVNDAGEVVGWAARPGGNEHNSHAFLYRRSRMYDLNECLVEPLPSPLRLTDARDINELGEIAAWGCDPATYGRCRSYLLVPVEGD